MLIIKEVGIKQGCGYGNVIIVEYLSKYSQKETDEFDGENP